MGPEVTPLTGPEITLRPARDLSDIELEERADVAFKVDQRLKKSLQFTRIAAWETAEACADMADTQGFLDLGFDSLNEYLGDPAIGISRGFFMKLAQVARFARTRQLVDEMRGLELTKVQIVIGPIRDGKVPANEALSDAKVLSRRDLIEKYLGGNGVREEIVPVSFDAGREPTAVDEARGELHELLAEETQIRSELLAESESVEALDMEVVEAEVVKTIPRVTSTDLQACRKLHELLLDGVNSGQVMPRVNGHMVESCLDALMLLIDEMEALCAE